MSSVNNNLPRVDRINNSGEQVGKKFSLPGDEFSGPIANPNQSNGTLLNHTPELKGRFSSCLGGLCSLFSFSGKANVQADNTGISPLHNVEEEIKFISGIQKSEVPVSTRSRKEMAWAYTGGAVLSALKVFVGGASSVLGSMYSCICGSKIEAQENKVQPDEVEEIKVQETPSTKGDYETTKTAITDFDNALRTFNDTVNSTVVTGEFGNWSHSRAETKKDTAIANNIVLVAGKLEGLTKTVDAFMKNAGFQKDSKGLQLIRNTLTKLTENMQTFNSKALESDPNDLDPKPGLNRSPHIDRNSGILEDTLTSMDTTIEQATKELQLYTKKSYKILEPETQLRESQIAGQVAKENLSSVESSESKEFQEQQHSFEAVTQDPASQIKFGEFVPAPAASSENTTPIPELDLLHFEAVKQEPRSQIEFGEFVSTPAASSENTTPIPSQLGFDFVRPDSPSSASQDSRSSTPFDLFKTAQSSNVVKSEVSSSEINSGKRGNRVEKDISQPEVIGLREIDALWDEIRSATKSSLDRLPNETNESYQRAVFKRKNALEQCLTDVSELRARQIQVDRGRKGVHNNPVNVLLLQIKNRFNRAKEDFTSRGEVKENSQGFENIVPSNRSDWAGKAMPSITPKVLKPSSKTKSRMATGLDSSISASKAAGPMPYNRTYECWQKRIKELKNHVQRNYDMVNLLGEKMGDKLLPKIDKLEDSIRASARFDQKTKSTLVKEDAVPGFEEVYENIKFECYE